MLGGTTATVHVLSDDGDSLDLAGLAGLPPDFEGTVYASLPSRRRQPATEVRAPVRSSRSRRSPRPRPATSGIGDPVLIDLSFVVVPLVDADEHPFGALAIGFADGKVLSAAEHQSLADLAAQPRHAGRLLFRLHLDHGASPEPL